MTHLHPGIRPNPNGDTPEIHESAFVDPSAQIMGNVVLGPRVYVGPMTVIRADEPGPDGRVEPVVVEEDTFIQDGVIIHSRAGTRVEIGSGCNIAHGVIIHGPARIGARCFIALRGTLYASTLADECWVGIAAVVMRTAVPSHTMIPAGAMVRSESDVRSYRFTNVKEREYFDSVIQASSRVREGYRCLDGQGSGGAGDEGASDRP